MTDSVGGNFVSAAVKCVHVLDAFANLLGRATKADAGIASPLVWACIDIPAAVGDEIAAADKEGKVNALAILVQFGSEVGELLPALELSTIVEGHDNELRRAIDRRPPRRRSAKSDERRQCGDELLSGQVQPPRPKPTAMQRKHIRSRSRIECRR